MDSTILEIAFLMVALDNKIFAFFLFFLRWLSASFKKGGFDALAAEAGAESATSQFLSDSSLLAARDGILRL